MDDACLTKISIWQPITLLNVDNKILTKLMGRRIEQTIQKLFPTDQTGLSREGARYFSFLLNHEI